jgi:diguanylate cyclase (GGDEF)-like protein
MLAPSMNTTFALDGTTLVISGAIITAALGVFLLSTWAQERIRALAWWGVAYVIGGVAVAVWSVENLISPPLPHGIANTLLFLACGMIWSAARIFHGRPVLRGAMAAGAALWLAACMFTDLIESTPTRVALSSLIVSAYTLLTAAELWRERRKSILLRWQAVLMPVLHGAVFLTPILLTTLLPDDGGGFGSARGLLAVFALESVLYVVGAAFIILVLAKEHSLRIQRDAALTDELTGALNRRGFFAAAEKLMARQAASGQPLSVLMFDLDHFKSINDRFGHAAGDATLKLFAGTASGSMRCSDILARLGGEEFAAVLPCSLADATMVAQRVRSAFQAAAGIVAGAPVAGTVSVGAAGAERVPGIAGLLAAADQALYRAKANGRNRVECGEPARTGTSDPGNTGGSTSPVMDHWVPRLRRA